MCTDIPTCTCTQGCTKASCVQKVHNTCEEQLTFISLDTDVQKSRGILFRKCTIFVTNDLLLLAWTLTYRKVGVFCSENVQYLSWLTIGLDVDVRESGGVLFKVTCVSRPVKSLQYLWQMTCCYWLGHWCTGKWGCSIQKVYNMCDEWLNVTGLDTDVQKSGSVCISGSGIWLADYNGLTDNTNLVPFIPFGDLDQYSPLFQGFIVFWTYIIIFQVRELGLLWWAEYVQYICCTHMYGSC